jgi:hypothetical protein
MLRRFHRLPRASRDRELRWALAWAAALILLETAGRLHASEALDALGLLALGLLAMATAKRHRAQPLLLAAPVRHLVQRIRRSVRSLDLEVGLDLAGTPPIPGRWPRIHLGIGLALLALAALLLVLAPSFPGAIRGTLAPISVTFSLLVQGTIWATTMALASLPWMTALCLAHDCLVPWQRRVPPPRPALRRAILAASLALSAAILFSLPTPLVWRLWVAILLGNALVALGPGALPGCLLWRRPVAGSPARALPRPAPAAAKLGLGLGVLVLAILTGGSSGTGSGEVPVPSNGLSFALHEGLLRSALLWELLSARDYIRRLWARSLAAWWRRRLWTVVAPGMPAWSDRWRAHQGARRKGLRLRFGGAARPHELPLAELPAAAPRDAGIAGILDAFDNPQFLRHRLRVRALRILRRGIRKLWRVARARRYSRGCAFWFLPWCWFVPHLSRDANEERLAPDQPILEEGIGPPYSALFPWPVRLILGEVTRRTGIHAILVEDGVRARAICRVLACLFAVDELFDGTARAEEHHFRGLPGIRTVIHEVELGRPWQQSGYPEPDYEDVGRGRILHVFRDREQDPDEAHVPVLDTDRDLSPAGGPGRA